MSSKNIVTGTLVAVSLSVALGACVKKQKTQESDQNVFRFVDGGDPLQLFRMRKGLYPNSFMDFTAGKQDECNNLPDVYKPVLKNYLIQDFHWKRPSEGIGQARYYGRVCIARDGRSAWLFGADEPNPSLALVKTEQVVNGATLKHFVLHNLATGSSGSDFYKDLENQPQIGTVTELVPRGPFGQFWDSFWTHLNPFSWIYGGGRAFGSFFQIKFEARSEKGSLSADYKNQALFYRRALPQGLVPLFNEEWVIKVPKGVNQSVSNQSKEKDLKTLAKVWSVPLWKSWSIEDLQAVYQEGNEKPVCELDENGTLAGDGKGSEPSKEEEQKLQNAQEAIEKDPRCHGKTPFMNRAILMMLPTVMEMMRSGNSSQTNTEQSVPGTAKEEIKPASRVAPETVPAPEKSKTTESIGKEFPETQGAPVTVPVDPNSL